MLTLFFTHTAREAAVQAERRFKDERIKWKRVQNEFREEQVAKLKERKKRLREQQKKVRRQERCSCFNSRTSLQRRKRL
jgi:hypothetical protein